MIWLSENWESWSSLDFKHCISWEMVFRWFNKTLEKRIVLETRLLLLIFNCLKLIKSVRSSIKINDFMWHLVLALDLVYPCLTMTMNDYWLSLKASEFLQFCVLANLWSILFVTFESVIRKKLKFWEIRRSFHVNFKLKTS